MDTVEWGLRRVLQNSWQPSLLVSLCRFVVPNPLRPWSTFEPVVDVAVPLDEADSSSTELQHPFTQTNTYAEANTELEEEINALNQSWLEFSAHSQTATHSLL
jgi:hypothetical protein